MNPFYNGNPGNNNQNNFIQQLGQFAKTIKGDPTAQVEQLIRSGKMSQDQYHNFRAQAEQMLNAMPSIRNIFGI